MITVLRGWLKGKTAKTIMVITILALAGVFSLPTFFKDGGGSLSQWAVKVNDTVITQGELMLRSQARQQQAQLIRGKYGESADFILAAYGLEGEQTGRASEMLIGEALLNQAAKKTNIALDDDYIQTHGELVLSELMGVLGDVIDPHYGFNVHKMRAVLNRYGLSANFVEDVTRRLLERHLMVDLMSGAAYVPRFEIDQHIRNNYVPRTYSLLVFPYNQAVEMEKKAGVSDTDLAAYYKKATEAQGRYGVPEKRSATVYYFTPAGFGTVVTDEEIERYYDDHKTSRFVQEPVKVTVRKIVVGIEEEALAQVAFEKAQQLRNKITQENVPFSKVAQESSDDKVSASQGGLLAPFARRTYDDAFEKAAFMLAKDGDISPVTRTKEGFVILQRVAKKPAIFKSLASVKGDISKTLLQRNFSEQFMKDASEITSANRLDKAQLDAFVKEKNGRKETLQSLERNNETWGKILFGLQEGEAAATLVDDAGALVVLTGVAKRYLPTLEAIKGTVKDDLCEERAVLALTKNIEKAAQELKKDSAAAVAQRFGARLETVRDITPEKEDTIKNLEKRGVPVQEMLQIEKVGGVVVVSGKQDGFIAKLESIAVDSPLAHDPAKKAELIRSLQAQEESLLAQGLVASLYRNATITSNDQLLPDDTAQSQPEIPYEDFSY